MGRLDQHREPVPSLYRTGNTRLRKELCRGEQLHQTADREILCHVYLRLQISGPLGDSLQPSAQAQTTLQGQAGILRHQF